VYESININEKVLGGIGSENAIGNRARNSFETSDVHDFEPRSIVTERSEEHPTKHDSQIISTEAGSSIEVRPLHANAIRSIRDSFELDANEIDVNAGQNWKHASQIT
jgi:hypothetical protein